MAVAVAKIPAKRVDIVKIQMVKDGSISYPQRFINTPQDAAQLGRNFLQDLDREAVLVICLDVKNQPTAINMVSLGTLHNSLVHPRELFKTAILANSGGLIVVHNHPSGIPEPSKDDVTMTERLVEAGTILGIDILDHIIIGHNSYASFREMGLM